MKLLYTTGPKRVTMGAAGAFERGVSKEVNQKLAARLTRKKTIRFYEDGKVPKEAMEELKRLEAAEKKATATVAAKAAADKPQKKEG